MALGIRDLFGWIVTDCPLCQGPCAHGKLCEGCWQDTFVQRQQRALCIGCASDLGDSGYFKPLSIPSGRYVRQMCRPCQRRPAPYAWIDCALDGRFPEALMLERFSKQRTDLSLAPVLADLVWQSFQNLRRSVPAVEAPDYWIALPATERQLERCRCSPSHELARALARLSALPLRSGWLAVNDSTREACNTAVDVSVSDKVCGRAVGRVLDQIDSLDPVARVAQALRVAGARQVVVVCAARNHSLWQNHHHVSCDPG